MRANEANVGNAEADKGEADTPALWDATVSVADALDARDGLDKALPLLDSLTEPLT